MRPLTYAFLLALFSIPTLSSAKEIEAGTYFAPGESYHHQIVVTPWGDELQAAGTLKYGGSYFPWSGLAQKEKSNGAFTQYRIRTTVRVTYRNQFGGRWDCFAPITIVISSGNEGLYVRSELPSSLPELDESHSCTKPSSFWGTDPRPYQKIEKRSPASSPAVWPAHSCRLVVIKNHNKIIHSELLENYKVDDEVREIQGSFMPNIRKLATYGNRRIEVSVMSVKNHDQPSPQMDRMKIIACVRAKGESCDLKPALAKAEGALPIDEAGRDALSLAFASNLEFEVTCRNGDEGQGG